MNAKSKQAGTRRKPSKSVHAALKLPSTYHVRRMKIDGMTAWVCVVAKEVVQRGHDVISADGTLIYLPGNILRIRRPRQKKA